MSLANIITNAAAILGTVTGVGSKVHAYERYASDEAALRSLFVENSKVCGWTLTREATTSQEAVGGCRDTHIIVIRGYYSLDDSANTEKTFQDLLEAIRTAFDANRQLAYGTPTIYAAHSSDRMSVRTVGHCKLGGVLLHYAEVVLNVLELV